SGTIPSPTRSKRRGSHATKRSLSATSPAASWPSGSGRWAYRPRSCSRSSAAGAVRRSRAWSQAHSTSTSSTTCRAMRGCAAARARRLRERRLAKRAVDLPATELPADAPAWAADDPELQQHVEDRLAGEVGLRPGELFLDFPAKPDMLALDLPLVQRDGAVIQLAGADATAQLGLPRVAGELHRLAWRLLVFVLGSATVSAKAIVELVMLPRDEVLERVEQ